MAGRDSHARDTARTAAFQQHVENRLPTPPLPYRSPVLPRVPHRSREPSANPKQWDDTRPIDATAGDRMLHFQQQLFDAGKSEVFYTLTRAHDSSMPKTAVLNIATLQHQVLQALQYDIAQYVTSMYQNSQFRMELEGFPPLPDLMDQYCDAVRNMDYMKHCALRGYDGDPFLMKSSRALERNVMETVGLIPQHVLPAGTLPIPRDADHPRLRTMGRNEENRRAREQKRWRRYGMAGLGGLLLIAPMLIMALKNTKLANLVTTCVAISVFGLLVPWFTELGPNEVLATTAAYAAVLVVFVGTTLTPVHNGAH